MGAVLSGIAVSPVNMSCIINSASNKNTKHCIPLAIALHLMRDTRVHVLSMVQ